MHNHHALNMQRALQCIEIVDGSLAGCVTSLAGIEKAISGAEDMNVTVAGIARYLESRWRMHGAKN